MATDSGRSPSGRAGRPADGAPAGLRDTATIPNAVADKLRKARALVERGWTQEADARSKTGRAVVPWGRSAVCYCANGAINSAFANAPFLEHIDAKECLRDVIGTYFIPGWNDAPERTQAEVLAAFDKAIELAEATNA